MRNFKEFQKKPAVVRHAEEPTLAGWLLGQSATNRWSRVGNPNKGTYGGADKRKFWWEVPTNTLTGASTPQLNTLHRTVLQKNPTYTQPESIGALKGTFTKVRIVSNMGPRQPEDIQHILACV